MSDKLVLACKGRSSHRIVVPHGSVEAIRTAGMELQRVLREISGVQLPIVSDSESPVANEIVVGSTRRKASLLPEWRTPGLGPEDYVLRTAGSRLFILGGGPRGTLYGVYGFLRDQLACRWFTPGVSRIPRRSTIAIGPLDEVKAPAFEYRNFILDGIDDPAWGARNAFNGFNSPVTQEFGGRRTHWQYGHSFHALLPVERYFKKHPEYFDAASRRKTALDDPINVCCTNSKVARIVTDNLRRVIEESLAAEQKDPGNPAPDVYYLAQNDGGSPCHCPACSRLVRREGSFSAPLLHLCNQVVEAIDREYPDRSMMTIAYRFSRRPPRHMRAHPKLIVQLCSIECCQSHPFATCDDEDNRLFREDMEGWERTAERLWVWSYMARLWHPFLAGPGFGTLAEDLRWFHDHKVRGMFQQTGGERDFKWLNAWLMCQALRDPRGNWRASRDEFLAAYYGPAAEPLRTYMNLLDGSIRDGNHHLHYKEGAVKPFFSFEIERRGRRLFAAAEDAVRCQPELLGRVREERMHFLCTALQHAGRRAVLHAGHVRKGRLTVSLPAKARKEAQAFVDWRKKRFGRAEADSCTMHVESEIVTLPGKTLELDFLPRLAGRLVAMRHMPTGHDFLSPLPGSSGEFDLRNGYSERWLAAPAPYEDESVSGWGFHKGRGSSGAAESGSSDSIAAGTLRHHYLYEIGGKFMHPMQWERWVRLDAKRPFFHIESQVVNRGIHPADGAMETCLPLWLGNVAGVTLESVEGMRPAAAGRAADSVLASDEVAQGVVFANRALGIGLGFRVTGRAVKSVRIHVDRQSQRLVVRVETKAIMLMPGAGYRICQFVDVRT